MAKKVTLLQIAQKVGISVNAVSRALNDKSDISESTKAKVRQAVAVMDMLMPIRLFFMHTEELFLLTAEFSPTTQQVKWKRYDSGDVHLWHITQWL